MVSGFFSSSETGMMALNRYRLRYRATAGQRTAIQLQKLLERPDRILGVILIGNTLANILATSLATFLALHLFGNEGVAIAAFLLTLIILVFAEVMPKTVAALYPERLTTIVAWPLSLLLWLIYPLVWIINTIVNTILLLFGIRVKKKNIDHLNREELRLLVRESSSAASKHHRDMLLSLLDLEQSTIEDVMVPRHEIVAIDIEDDWKDIVKLLCSYPHKYLPLYRNNIDQLIGIVDIQSIFHLVIDNRLNKDALMKAAFPLHFIPESTKLYRQLLRFQKEKCQCGLVVDEYGSLRGFVSLTDILEEIVGEFIRDIDTVSLDIQCQSDGSCLVAGAVNLRELNREMGWLLPTTSSKTLSGLIIEELEAIPRSGTSLKIANYYIEVVQVKDNRIKSVKIKPAIDGKTDV